MKATHCYDKHSNLLCIIENDAISEMTWHEDGLYIYTKQLYEEYDEFRSKRNRRIKCNWTKTEDLDESTIQYLKKQNVLVIFNNEAIGKYPTEMEDIGF